MGRGRASAGRRDARGLSLRDRAMLAVAPAVLCLAHFWFGASRLEAALTFTCVLGLGLAGVLAFPKARTRLSEIRFAEPLAGLFIAVLAVAAWTLTPWTPGGAHPIWAWAGVEPGAATVNRSATLIEMVKLGGLACAFVLGASQGARRVQAQATLEAVVAVGAVYAGVSLLLFLGGIQLSVDGRLNGGFASANSGATVFGLLSVVGLAVLLRRWRRTAGENAAAVLAQVSAPAAAVILFVTCLLLTASRMGVMAALVAAAVLILWESLASGGRRWPMAATGALLLGVGALLAARGSDMVWTRAENLGADADLRRMIYEAHWRAFLDSPLFGYGLGSFTDINTQITTSQTYPALTPVRAMHNVYLQWLGEAGLVGATPMFLSIALVIGLAVWRLGRISTGRTLLRGLIVANLVVLLHGLTDFALQIPSIAAFWAFLLGLQFAFGQSRS